MALGRSTKNQMEQTLQKGKRILYSADKSDLSRKEGRLEIEGLKGGEEEDKSIWPGRVRNLCKEETRQNEKSPQGGW